MRTAGEGSLIRNATPASAVASRARTKADRASKAALEAAAEAGREAERLAVEAGQIASQPVGTDRCQRQLKLNPSRQVKIDPLGS